MNPNSQFIALSGRLSGFRPAHPAFLLLSILAVCPGRGTAMPTSETPGGRFSTAGFFSVEGAPRRVLNFNPGWRFLKSDAAGAEAVDFDDSAWAAANLPHGLELQGENASGMRNYQGPAWYRKQFTLDAADVAGNKALTIYFESVMGRATVWINGHKAVEHVGGYLPFAVDLAGLVHEGRNVIAVRADNSDDPTYPPGKSQSLLDFAYLGGIYRDVYLIETGRVHVTLPELSGTVAGGGVFVGIKDVRGDDADIGVRTEVINGTRSTAKVVIRSVLENAEGKELLRKETSVELPTGDAAQVTQELQPRGVRLWYPDDPYLHFVRTEVVRDGAVVDSLRTRFGIRKFEMRGKEGFFVNGKFIGHELSGVNRHQDYVYVGNALPNSGQWRDVKLLREGGSNIVRAAHYPMDPAFYDACDELGMLTTTANPGWQFFNRDAPEFERRIYEDTRALVRRDRNRPSMLLWETALNETPAQPPRLLKEMHRIAHEEFPFPGLFTVADVDEAEAGGLDFAYHADPESHWNSFTREYGDGGEVDNFYSQNATTRVPRAWGEHALIGQAMIRARDLDGIHGTPPARLGASVWCGIDHQRGYHPDPFWGGLLDVYRVPRYSYQLFKSQYDAGYKVPGIQTGPMVYIAHELTQISPSDVVVFTNCEEVRLTWLGKVIGVGRPMSRYPHMPHPPVVFRNAFDFRVIHTDWRSRTSKIEMIAEGLIDGRVVAREVKKYPERETGLKLEVDGAGMGLTADGSDFIPIRARVIDNKGVPKVLAQDYVHFTVEGPAEIIGDASNQANPFKLQFGVATVLLRASTMPGRIKIRASAPGLETAEIEIASMPCSLPLAYDETYAKTSTRMSVAIAEPIQAEQTSSSNTQVEKLKAEVGRLMLELTSKEQDIMELRSKLK